MAAGGATRRAAVTGPEVVTIRGIAAGGEGVGTLADGRTVFVPRTAPGDRVTLHNLRLHARFARADMAEVVTASPDRVTPPCPHYIADRCGGCQLMHLDAEAQLAAKRRIAGDAMRRIAKLDRDDPPIVAAPAMLGYRSKVTFAIRGRTIGFHRLGEAGHVFEVERCLLLEPGLDALHRRLRQLRHLLPDDAEQVVLRRDAEGGLHLLIRGTAERAWDGGPDLATALGGEVVVWWQPPTGAARAMAGSGAPWPATVFEQVNPPVADAVRRHAIAELVGDDPAPAGAVAWDLYAGIGEATTLLATAGLDVTSVERDPRAVALAGSLGAEGPVRLAGDVAVRIGRLPRPQLVFTNPPRTGMAEPVTAALARSGARRIVYVSCDPGTLARDLRRLGDQFHLTHFTAFDQFPQTAHLECVATLES